MSTYITDLTNDLTCPICLEFLSHPIILPCCHVLCRSPCAENILSANFSRCPVCRESCQISGGISSLPRVITLESIIEKVRAEQNRLHTHHAPHFTNNYSSTGEGLLGSSLQEQTCEHSLPDTSTIGLQNADYDSIKCGSTHGVKVNKSSPLLRLHYILNSQQASSTPGYALLPSPSSSSLSENEGQHVLNTSFINHNLQSEAFPIKSQRSAALSPVCQLDNKEGGTLPVNHVINTNKGDCHNPLGVCQLYRNIISNSSRGSNVEQLTDTLGDHCCLPEELDLENLKLDSATCSTSANINSNSNDNIRGCGYVGQYETADAKRQISKHLRRLSDIQGQLLAQLVAYQKQAVDNKDVLEKRRCEISAACDSLVADVEHKRFLYLEKITEDSIRTQWEVGEAVAVTEDLLVSSQEVTSLAENFLSITEEALTETEMDLQNRLTALLRKCEFILTCLESCAVSRLHQVIDLRHETRRLQDICYLARPTKPLIDIQRCTRSSHIVALVISPPPAGDEIDGYEIFYCSKEQKLQGIEEECYAKCQAGSTTTTVSPGHVTFVVIENLSSNTHYYFWACAVNSIGRSPNSDYVHCQTLMPVILNNTRHASLCCATICCPCPAQVTAHQGVSHCILYRPEGCSYLWTGVELQPREEHRIQGLHPETDYQFVVLARNLRGECQLSEKISLKTWSKDVTE